MLSQLLLVSWITTLVEAQRGNADLMRALRSVPELSMFTRAVEDHYQMIDDVKNKTILAPNNAAYRSRLSQAAVFDGISRYLDGNQYNSDFHTLQGVWPTLGQEQVISTDLDFRSEISLINSNPPPGLILPVVYPSATTQNISLSIKPNDSGLEILSGNSSIARTVNSSIPFDGGVIHIIDKYLKAPSTLAETLIALNLTAAYGVLQRTGLLADFDATRDLVLFLPTNEAFRRVGGFLEQAQPNELNRTLLHHRIFGDVLLYIDPETKPGKYATGYSRGSYVNITQKADDKWFINQAEILLPNIPTLDGVVHVIGSVLSPTNYDFPEPKNLDVLPHKSATDVPFTSLVPTPTGSVPVFSQEITQSSKAASPTTSGRSSAGSACNRLPSRLLMWTIWVSILTVL